MVSSLKINGIYDQRTLNLISELGVKLITFDFNPKSFNFIQEHVFFNELLVLVPEQNYLVLNFSRSNDPMISRLILNLKSAGRSLSKIVISCDDWSDSTQIDELLITNIDLQFIINHTTNFNVNLIPLSVRKKIFGLSLSFDLLYELSASGKLNHFAADFYRIHSEYIDRIKLILDIRWGSNLYQSLFDIFDFDTISVSINSDIEICYRNVDLKKLQHEISVLKSIQL